MATDLTPRIPDCCGSVLTCAQDTLISRRLAKLLCKYIEQHPSMFVRVDIWRPMVVSASRNQYKDQKTEKWVRIAEQVEIAVMDRSERAYQANVGVVIVQKKEAWVPDYYSLQPNDHLEFPHAQAFIIEELTEQAGFVTAKIEKVKSRFVKPDRSEPTYRILSMGARII